MTREEMVATRKAAQDTLLELLHSEQVSADILNTLTLIGVVALNRTHRITPNLAARSVRMGLAKLLEEKGLNLDDLIAALMLDHTDVAKADPNETQALPAPVKTGV